MKNKEDLIDKLFSGDISDEELKQLNKWYDSFNSDEELTVYSHENITADEIKKRMYSKITSDISHSLSTKKPPLFNYKSNYSKFAAAAIILILLGSITFFLSINSTNSINEIVEYVEKFNPRGKRSKLTLADGTQIWLNAESNIKIPKKFDKNKREVILEGEAFFEVTKDNNRPFIVKTDNIITTVLGTSFNVRAYNNTVTTVTVADGRVKVSNTSNKISNTQEYFLLPNDQVSFNSVTGKIKKAKVSSIDFSSWKDGIIVFDEKNLGEVAEILEREFDVEIFLTNEKLNSCVLHGKYREEKLDNILKSIKYALNIEYNYTPKGITINGEGCN